MNQSLDLYKYFYAAAKLGNISEAAKALYTSQPVVSKYIHRLETELGVQLFLRTSRGVNLTEEGYILFEYVENALNSLSAGTDELQRKLSLGIGQLRMGVSTTLCKYFLLPYLRKYIEINPNVKIAIECQATNHTIESLLQGKIDIGIIGKPDDISNINFYDMMDIEDIFVATDTYIENLDFSHSRSFFDSGTIMMLDRSNITRQYIDRYLETHHITASNLLEISSMDLIIEFAKISMGVGCVIKEFIKDELKAGTLIELPLKTHIPKRKIGFAIKKQGYMPTPLKMFLDMMNIHSI